MTAYTDSSYLNNRDENATAGAGIWYAPNDMRNLAIRVPVPCQSNQTREITAIYQAVKQNLARSAPLHIVSNSKYAIEGLTVNLHSWAEKGYIGIANKNFFQATAALL